MDRFDRLADALGRRYRRQLLVALREENPQPALGPLDGDSQLEPDGAGAVRPAATPGEIVHTHLPKLAHYGYIDWDRQTDQISKGPEWDEVEPLLRVLTANEDELPADWT